MEEKTLEDFFKNSSSDYSNKKSKYYKKNERVNNFNSNSKLLTFFKNKFSFDTNVILSNQTNVLYRRNYCIRNIIFLLNLVFILFSFVGISKSNYILTIVFFLLVTGLSQTIKFMLKSKKDDYSHQTIIMYLQCLFALVLSVILYVKVLLGFMFINGSSELTNAQFAVTQAAYFLIYISIMIMSLYQDPKLLKVMFFWSLLIMTVINITALHPDLYSHASSIKELFNYAFIDNKTISVDVLLRTIVFLVFYIALYSQTSITHYMFEERKNELKKRIGVETDFRDIVESVLDVVKVYNLNEDVFKERISSRRILSIAKELSKAMNYNQELINEILNYSTIHSDRMRELSINEYQEINSDNYPIILSKTKLATEIIKRLQLHKKAEDIVQAIFNGEDDEHFKLKMSSQNENEKTNIILLSEVYDILRSDRPYKKALDHVRALEMIMGNLSIYFNSDLIIRFNKFNNEIKQAYDMA